MSKVDATIVKFIDQHINNMNQSRYEDDRHLSFCRALMPSLKLLDDAETLEFQIAVIQILQDIKKEGTAVHTTADVIQDLSSPTHSNSPPNPVAVIEIEDFQNSTRCNTEDLAVQPTHRNSATIIDVDEFLTLKPANTRYPAFPSTHSGSTENSLTIIDVDEYQNSTPEDTQDLAFPSTDDGPVDDSMDSMVIIGVDEFLNAPPQNTQDATFTSSDSTQNSVAIVAVQELQNSIPENIQDPASPSIYNDSTGNVPLLSSLIWTSGNF